MQTFRYRDFGGFEDRLHVAQVAVEAKSAFLFWPTHVRPASAPVLRFI